MNTYLRDTSHRTGGELVDEGEGLLWLVRHDGRPADLGTVESAMVEGIIESAQRNIENGSLTTETRRQPKKEGMKRGERRVETREMENEDWREEM